MVEILRFESGHYPAARELWERTRGVGISSTDQPHLIVRFLERNPGLSFVAMRQGELVGTVLVGHDGRRGIVHHLAVADHAQRQGIGRRLVREAMQGLAAAGISKCNLFVYSNNLAGRAFWAALGAEHRQSLAIYALPTEHAARDRHVAHAPLRGKALSMTPDSRLYRFGAVVCGLLALVAGWVAVTLGGAPKADFDVTGLLWVMQNGPRLLAMVVAATFAFWAVWCGIRARGR